MSVLMFLAASRKKRQPQPFSRTFTSNEQFIVPAGVTSVNMSGRGARGTDEGFIPIGGYNTAFTTTSYQSNGNSDTTSGSLGFSAGPVPFDYCETGPGGGIYAYTVTCYYYTYEERQEYRPATTGAAATAIGRSFPGSTGNVTPATTTFSNVPVTAGGSGYPIVVPSGGTITISWVL